MTTFEIESPADVPKAKTPKRILHFSDGILEEYSSDEDDTDDIQEKIDPSSMTWGPWCMYYVKEFASRTYAIADRCGERIAWMLGITSPKYIYAIEAHKKAEKLKEEEMERLREEKLQEEIDGISSIDVQFVGKRSKTSNDTLDEDGSGKY